MLTFASDGADIAREAHFGKESLAPSRGRTRRPARAVDFGDGPRYDQRSSSSYGVGYDVIDTPTRSAETSRDAMRETGRSGNLSTADVSWRVRRQIFKHRFMLTTAGGEIRAVTEDFPGSRRRR
jgi:hypothetical protein